MSKFFERSEDSPKLTLDSRFIPGSFNLENRTVKTVFTTERKVLISSWFEEPYYEILSTKKEHIRTERVEKGIPVLDGHDWSGSVLSQLGIAEGLEFGKELLTTMRFSKKEDAQTAFQDIADGIIKSTSIGYRVYKYEDVSEENAKIKTYLAVDWEPLEISLVPIPADPGAQIRKLDLGESNMKKRSEEVKEEVKEETKEVSEVVEELKEEVKEEIKEEIKEEVKEETKEVSEVVEEKRSLEIIKLVRKANLGIELAEKYIAEKRNLNEVSSLLIDEMAKRQGGQVKQQITIEKDQKELTREGMSNAILHRAGVSKELDENARRFRNLSLMDMARHVSGLDMNASKDEIVNRAFHSTSDFPSILLDATNKSLQNQYAEFKQSFDPFTRRVSLSDFKMKHTVKMGDFPELKKVVQNEEVKAGTITESKEAYKLDSYASKIKISRQALINDDLEAFSRLPGMAARSAKYLESMLVYNLITSNPNMADGQKFISSAHKNVVAGPALDVATLDLAWAAMKKQVGVDGKTKLNLTPSNILVPVALESAALRLVSKEMMAAQASNINVYAGRLGVISDALLDDSSVTKWYILGMLGEIDIFELATLDGAGPKTHMEEVFASGIAFSVLHDVGAGIIDHRGIVGVGTF